jgi:hypothetical protein
MLWLLSVTDALAFAQGACGESGRGHNRELAAFASLQIGEQLLNRLLHLGELCNERLTVHVS